MILAVTAEEDVHAVSVLRALRRLGAEAVIVDLREFPCKSSLALELGPQRGQRVLELGGRSLNLDEVGAVWWRRPQPFEVDDAVGDRIARNFAFHEAVEAVEGMWLTLDASWINPPARDEQAARKVWQLDVAREVGLRTPRTLVTNDPERARAFARAEGVERTIYKAFQGSEQAWRETRLLRRDEFELLDSVRFAPVIFQEYVDAVVDLRVTVVDGEIFPAAIHSQASAYKVDFRMDMAGTHIVAEQLPAPVNQAIRELMTRMGLVYGAIDLRRTPDGDYVFLEINPAGQWLFVEDETGQPITQRLAEVLVREDRRRHEARRS